ncbi:MAG: hypothetical protein WCK35_23735 [Chloroflexota bacterium]
MANPVSVFKKELWNTPQPGRSEVIGDQDVDPAHQDNSVFSLILNQ